MSFSRSWPIGRLLQQQRGTEGVSGSGWDPLQWRSNVRIRRHASACVDQYDAALGRNDTRLAPAPPSPTRSTTRTRAIAFTILTATRNRYHRATSSRTLSCRNGKTTSTTSPTTSCRTTTWTVCTSTTRVGWEHIVVRTPARCDVALTLYADNRPACNVHQRVGLPRFCPGPNHRLVETIRSTIRTIDPNVQLSAAVWRDPDVGYKTCCRTTGRGWSKTSSTWSCR